MNKDLRASPADELQLPDCPVARARAKRIATTMLIVVREAIKIAPSLSERKDMTLMQIGLSRTSNEMQGSPQGVSKT